MDLTKYEKARLIGARALQLFFGGPPKIKISAKEEVSCIQIAEKELDKELTGLVVLKEKETEQVQ